MYMIRKDQEEVHTEIILAMSVLSQLIKVDIPVYRDVL